MKKAFFLNLTVILFLLIIAYFTVWQFRDSLYEFWYDFSHENPPIFTKKEISEQFKLFPILSFKALEKQYKEYSKSNIPKYKKLLVDTPHHIISKEHLNKKIVGHFRVKDFLAKDKFYKDCIFNRQKSVIAILNKELLIKTLNLLNELKEAGYNPEAFDIVNGHRHPRYNENVGGAQLSRHIKGEAVDIYVGDINQDGYTNKEDKDIILDLLENKIIKNQGGIGLYPGTQSVHYDVRGYRARWNSY